MLSIITYLLFIKPVSAHVLRTRQGPNINLDLGVRFRVFFGQSEFDHKLEKIPA
jgi:hypothetical protein